MEKYYQELVNYFSSFLGNKEMALEVVQESYYRAFKAQKKSHLEEPRAFLYKTGKNIIIDNYRRELVKKNEPIDSYEILAPQSEEPETKVFKDRFDEALENVINSLPPRCKEAFILNRIQGHSQKEVATKMGISLNAVEKHIMRATKACKSAMNCYQ